MKKGRILLCGRKISLLSMIYDELSRERDIPLVPVKEKRHLQPPLIPSRQVVLNRCYPGFAMLSKRDSGKPKKLQALHKWAATSLPCRCSIKRTFK